MALTNSGWRNSSAGYGGLTKLLHWLIAALFAWQYAAGHVMTGMKTGEAIFGLGQAAAYNWHKSIGLLALAVALVRLWNRRQGTLPPWAPTLSATEQAFIHRCEQVLYTAMLVMPLSGFVYVMAGGYGVHLFGAWHLPNPLPPSAMLATFAKWVHIAGGWVLALALAGHIGLVLRHHLLLRDGLLDRMLPKKT